MSKVERDEVYRVINGERAYQDEARGNAQRTGAFTGQPLTPGEIILCAQKCLDDAKNEWYKPDGHTTCLPYLRKVAALCVQAMENYGAPHRE